MTDADSNVVLVRIGLASGESVTAPAYLKGRINKWQFQIPKKLIFSGRKSRLLKQKQIQTQIKKALTKQNPSPLLLRGDKVWRESSSINATIPAVSNEYVGVTTSGVPVELTADGSSTTNRTWKTGLTD